MSLASRCPGTLHPTRWPAWLVEARKCIGISQAKLAAHARVNASSIVRYERDGWTHDHEEPMAVVKRGRRPVGLFCYVVSVARMLGHTPDLRRWQVPPDIRYLLAMDITQVSYHEWAAYIAAHTYYLGGSQIGNTETLTPQAVERGIDAIGMCGSLARELYVAQKPYHVIDVIDRNDEGADE